MSIRNCAALCASLVLTLGFQAGALANGHIDAKNCSSGGMQLCLYDWDDAVVSAARQSAAA